MYIFQKILLENALLSMQGNEHKVIVGVETFLKFIVKFQIGVACREEIFKIETKVKICHRKGSDSSQYQEGEVIDSIFIHEDNSFYNAWFKANTKTFIFF